MTSEQKKQIYETFMLKTMKQLTEDFLDDVSIEDVKRHDDNNINPDYIMQDGRPVSEMLSGYTCFVHANSDNLLFRLKMMCERIQSVMSRLPFNLDASPIVISQGLSEDRWRYANYDTGYSTYEKYILDRPAEYNQNNKTLYKHAIFGIRLNGRPSYTKAFDLIYQICKIMFAFFTSADTNQVDFIFKAYSYDTVKIQRGSTTIVYKMKEAIACVRAAVDPNSAPLDDLIELFCTICGESYKKAWELRSNGYDEYVAMMR